MEAMEVVGRHEDVRPEASSACRRRAVNTRSSRRAVDRRDAVLLAKLFELKRAGLVNKPRRRAASLQPQRACSTNSREQPLRYATACFGDDGRLLSFGCPHVPSVRRFLETALFRRIADEGVVEVGREASSRGKSFALPRRSARRARVTDCIFASCRQRRAFARAVGRRCPERGGDASCVWRK